MGKKKIKLEKQTLMSLQEDQLKALIGGAEKMSTNSGAACGNTVELEIEKATEDSCCRRSCNGGD